MTQSKYFKVLPLARYVKPEAGSVQTMQFPCKGYGSKPWLRLRSVIHSPAPPTLPNRSAGLCRRVHLRRGGSLHHVAFFNISRQWQDLGFFCVIWLYYDKLSRMLKTSCAQVSSWFICLSKKCCRNTGPAKLKPIVVAFLCDKESFLGGLWSRPVLPHALCGQNDGDSGETASCCRVNQ